MSFDPEVEEALRPFQLKPPIWELPVPEARLRERALHAALNPPPRNLHQVLSFEIEGLEATIACEALVPRASDRPLPLAIYFHGGGCVLLDPGAYRPISSAIAEDADCIVLVPEYRLAPEHPFPAALEDAIAVYRWAIEEAGTLGADLSRVAVCGDSAGGYLATEITLDCAQTGVPQPSFQALVYPSTDLAGDWASYRLAGVEDTLREVEWLTQLYAGDDKSDPRASPLCAASHRGLPPAFILAAELDPLLDQGRAYPRKLSDSGVPVTHVVYSAVPHGFLSWSGKVEAGRIALAQLAAVLRRQLHP
jgi:acetyl esterase